MVEHVYIHIPFCIRKCNYCSFVSGFNIKDKQEYLEALFYEISQSYKKEKIKTLYIGGGTPSLLECRDIEKIINIFNFHNEFEITLETNPETVEKEKFKKIKDIGINRLSLGVQSFNDNILKLIGRNHTRKNIYEALINIKNAGFNNVSIDLIYGLPNQTTDILKDDINNALKLNIQHISTYGLKIEKESFFCKNPPLNLPDDEMQANMFLYLCKILEENNFNHYEISNFALNGYESKHNCAYWQNKNYYGFGLNASGYENNCRYKNISDFNQYLKSPLKKEENTKLTAQEILEDEIFLGLRLKEGINIEKINNKYNIDFEKKYKTIIQKYTALHLLEHKKNSIKLTEKGILLSNEVMSEFIEI